MAAYRLERDSMGELKVPADALYAPQTQRAVENFPVSGLRLPRPFLRALGLIKAAAAEANADLGYLRRIRHAPSAKQRWPWPRANTTTSFRWTVSRPARHVEQHERQRGDRAPLASAALTRPVHPNDHVNMGTVVQRRSSAVQVSAALCLHDLLPVCCSCAVPSIAARELARVAKPAAPI